MLFAEDDKGKATVAVVIDRECVLLSPEDPQDAKSSVSDEQAEDEIRERKLTELSAFTVDIVQDDRGSDDTSEKSTIDQEETEGETEEEIPSLKLVRMSERGMYIAIADEDGNVFLFRRNGMFFSEGG